MALQISEFFCDHICAQNSDSARAVVDIDDYKHREVADFCSLQTL